MSIAGARHSTMQCLHRHSDRTSLRSHLWHAGKALKFIRKPELARANLVSPNDIFLAPNQCAAIQGKVALVYFWASRCDVCLRGLPRLREIAKKFENQPFVILSVSADYDAKQWKSFLQKNPIPGVQ
jgi:thiol-disulfide isomerase/thioredoxin